MANGDIAFFTQGQTLIKLLDGASGAGTDGQWVDCREYDIGCVVIQGLATTATAEVDASNDLTIPANNTHGAPIAAKTAAATTAYVAVPVAPRWIKARVVDAGTGTVNAFAILRSNAQG